MKKIIFVVIVVILMIIINGLAHSMYDIWQKKDFVVQAQKELDFQKQENQRLQSSLSYSQTQDFIEKEARNKLFMVKKDEQKVLIPQGSESLQLLKKDNDPNWKKWWNLFF
ncbi:MAG: septum formation initiator family protein [Candidatus Levybacteria bacterium]|nr:septum formation initiator family protein [Candidatus Levybacteria bacterium]MDZ4227683.1 septum formation initiator family protein [Candidatus Levybacteria bacterium]